MSTGQPTRPKILVVDDDPAITAEIADALTTAGYRATEAEDGHRALSVVEGGDRIDLLVTQIKLPAKQPHGFALARLARARRPDVEIIYLSAYQDLLDLDAADRLGPVLFKPVDIHALTRKVAEVLQSDG